MNDLEMLALVQAVLKWLSKIVSTKDPDSLRSACDREMLQMFDENGIDRVQIRNNGIKTGTYSIRETKGKPYVQLTVTDAEAFEEWCVTEGYMVPDVDAVHAAVEANGVIPEGCKVERVEPEPVYSTVLKIDEQKVVDAYGGRLGNVVAGLIGEQ